MLSLSKRRDICPNNASQIFWMEKASSQAYTHRAVSIACQDSFATHLTRVELCVFGLNCSVPGNLSGFKLY